MDKNKKPKKALKGKKVIGCPCDAPKHMQPWTRDRQEHLGKIVKVNSDFIFNQKNFKPHTKGYDSLTGEIDKRGKPSDNQDKIFLKKPEEEPTQEEKIAERKKKEAKKREAYNKKLYRDRLKTKWDRGW